MSRNYQCAVIGLGSMGFGMAQSCVRAGLVTYGFDINDERVASFCAEGGLAAELADIAPKVDAIVLVVLNAQQVEDVLFGAEAISSKLKQGSVVMACATVAPDFSRSMAEKCNHAGIHYLDAPISGGAVKAAQGALSIMASGSKEAFEAAQTVLDATAETVHKLGDSAGTGSAVKAVNQMLAGVHIAAMAEALVFGMKQGVSAEVLLSVISKSAGNSWMFENRAPHVVDGDYTPRSSVTIWPKDLGIVMDVAQQAGLDTPITAAALQRYQEAVQMGLGSEDDAAVTKVYAKQAGVELPGQTS